MSVVNSGLAGPSTNIRMDPAATSGVRMSLNRLPTDLLNRISTFFETPAVLGLRRIDKIIYRSLRITSQIIFSDHFEMTPERKTCFFRMSNQVMQVPSSSTNPQKVSYFVSRTLDTLIFTSCSLQGKELEDFLEKFPHLHTLRLAPSYQIGNEAPWAEAIAKRGTNLHTLHLHSFLTDQELEAIAKGCNQLRTVYFAKSNNSCEYTKVTGKGVKAVFQYCKDLQSFELHNSHIIEGREIETSGEQYLNVHTLVFQRCLLFNGGLKAILRCCPNLRNLTLDMHALLDDELQAIAEHCANLESFQLEDRIKRGIIIGNQEHIQGTVTDNSLKLIVERCKKLHTINLSACLLIRDTALSAIAEHGKELQILWLSGPAVTEQGIEEVMQHCPKLHTLTICCPQITDRFKATLQRSKNVQIHENYLLPFSFQGLVLA